MVEIIDGKNIPIKDAAIFISKLNRQKKHHVGFCGMDREEVEKALLEDVSEMAAAIENGKLIGWIGADTEDDTAEVWGPFAAAGYDIKMAFGLWEKLMNQFPASVNNFILFSNRENKLVRNFAEKLQFEQKTDQAVLRFSRSQLKTLPNPQGEELQQPDHSAFIRLHDEAFSGTYYSGREIIGRLNQTQKFFVLKDQEQLAGYVYVEAEPDFGGGSIEFIAVDPLFQGKGYGKKLLFMAVHWLFSFDSIKEFKLTVALDNNNALGLYKAVGFQVEHELHYFVKQGRFRIQSGSNAGEVIVKKRT
jgi:ribosomal protein S18 acetylase RimI-like enzyme